MREEVVEEVAVDAVMNVAVIDVVAMMLMIEKAVVSEVH